MRQNLQNLKGILVGPVIKSVVDLRRLLKKHLKQGDLLIGVDGGTEWCLKAGWKPHFAVGDWDSLKNRKSLKDISFVTLPVKKDRSDLFFAALLACEVGVTELICFGATGGRTDHELGMLLDLSEIVTSGKRDRGLLACALPNEKGGEAFYFISHKTPKLKMSLPKGQIVSVFATRGVARGVVLKGFSYKLADGVLRPGSHGLSNVADGGECEVSVQKGSVVIILA